VLLHVGSEVVAQLRAPDARHFTLLPGPLEKVSFVAYSHICHSAAASNEIGCGVAIRIEEPLSFTANCHAAVYLTFCKEEEPAVYGVLAGSWMRYHAITRSVLAVARMCTNAV
jgi:hypothetical protein